MISERLQPSNLQELELFVRHEASAGQEGTHEDTAASPISAFGQPNRQPLGDPSGSGPSGSDLFGIAMPRYFR